MLNSLIVAAIVATQQPSESPKPEQVVLKAGLGPCSAEFLVKDASGNPAYGAVIHTRLRYGFMNVKRMDLEVSTDSDGKARVEGLPTRAKPVVYDIDLKGRKGKAEQNLTSSCQAIFAVDLKED